MNFNFNLTNGSISLENNILTINAQAQNTLFRKKDYYNINTAKFDIIKFVPPGKFLSPGLIKVNCIRNNISTTYNLGFPVSNKKSIDAMNFLMDIFKGNYIPDNNILTFVGDNGIIDLYNTKLVIKRDESRLSTLVLHGIKGDKEILLSSITAIQLKTSNVKPKAKPSTINGYIQFTILGGNESRSGFLEAAVDENTVTFTNAFMEDFKQLKELIYKNQETIKNNSILLNNSSNTQYDNLNAIEKLGELKDKNYITDEEFELKKKQLLGL